MLWKAKGYFPGARLTVSGKQYDLIFYDPVRLRQDIESELDHAGLLFEPNPVIIQSVQEPTWSEVQRFWWKQVRSHRS